MTTSKQIFLDGFEPDTNIQWFDDASSFNTILIFFEIDWNQNRYNYDCRIASKHFSVNEERRPFEDDEKRTIVERSNGVRRPN